MPGVFEPGSINGMTASNRLVRSATWEGLADDAGRVDERLLGLYDRLARGGGGLIISSYMYVRRDGRQKETQIGAHEDAMIPGLTRLVEVVHHAGGRLVAQIVHCGGQSGRDAIGGQQPLAPSAVESPGYPERPRARASWARRAPGSTGPRQRPTSWTRPARSAAPLRSCR